MRLGLICEFELGTDVEDVVEHLEEFVDAKKGQLTPADAQDITYYLGRYSDKFRMKVATLLGTSVYDAAGLAQQIAQGALIAYVGDVDTDQEMDRWDQGDEGQEVEPSQQVLDAIENPNKATPFQSSPPAFRPIDGGCPALDQMSDQLKHRLSRLAPSDFMDSGPVEAAIHQPFIYSSTCGLFVGPKYDYHSSITESCTDPVEAKVVTNIYYNGDYDSNYDYIHGSSLPGAVGRTGYNFSKMDKSLRHATIVAIYGKKGATEHPGTMQKCVQELLSKGYIPNDALVVYAGKLTNVPEILGGNSVQPSEEDILRSQLQAAYHVGTWPNGKRMTPEEKAALGRKLGLVSGPMRKNPWQQASEKAGMVTPGQKWWAPHSEGRLHRLREIG